MKKTIAKELIWAISIVVIIVTAGGCQEQNLSEMKRVRLISAENVRLKKDLEDCNKRVKLQKETLIECSKEKNFWKERSKATPEGLMGLSSDFYVRENAVLKQENEFLKAEVEQLEQELEDLKKQ
jgi:prefoldin subunit 5